DSDTSPKQKPIQATKGTRLMSKAKLATKRSKTQFYNSHASGSGDGVDTLSKVPAKLQQKTFGTDEGIGTIPGVPGVPKYDSESEKESWGDSDEEDDDDVGDFEDDAHDDGDDSDGNDDDEADSE
ncbi:hypothetical protein Tco_0330647, partial [Tanacetum coccineum]